MADSSNSSSTPGKSTELHAGIDVKKKTTRVNLVIVIGVLVFFATGVFLVIKSSRDGRTKPAGANPLNPTSGP